MIDMENISKLSEQQRFEIIKSQVIDEQVFNYLKQSFENLNIEICGDYEGTLVDLMRRGLLEGWCWETTETSIIFLNDDDYIDRGNLKFENNKIYYHSWICFKFADKEYVLDSCLNILCEKDLYYKVFEVDVKGSTTAKAVKDEFMYKMTHKLQTVETEQDMKIRKMMEDIFGSALDRQRKETKINGTEDVNSPMYRNSSGYIANIEDGKVKKLVAHYYNHIF